MMKDKFNAKNLDQYSSTAWISIIIIIIYNFQDYFKVAKVSHLTFTHSLTHPMIIRANKRFIFNLRARDLFRSRLRKEKPIKQTMQIVRIRNIRKNYTRM